MFKPTFFGRVRKEKGGQEGKVEGIPCPSVVPDVVHCYM